MQSTLLLTPLLALAQSAAPSQDDAHWPAWRGPFGTGVARGEAPTGWSDEVNVKWEVAIPGRGFSTPVVWGERIFLTTAVPTGKEPEAEAEEDDDRGRGRGRGGFGRRSTPLVEHHFLAMCLDRETGAVLWDRVLTTATPHEGYHRQYGSFASYSPVTDGERVYVSFGSQGVYCLDLAGTPVWDVDSGVKMQTAHSFGEGAAPSLAGDALVHLFDHEGQSFIVAWDKRTGKELWRRSRDEPTTWASPVPIEVGGSVQVVTTGTNRVRGYALDSGELLWECGGLGSNPIPVPMRHEDAVIAMSGHRDPNLMVIALGGDGDLTGTEAVRWSTTRGVPYTATPVLHDGLLYTVTDRGMMSCYDAATGEAHYTEERLPRGTELKASPVLAGGLLYVATESGDVHLIPAGTEFEVRRTNTLEGQMFISSPVVVDGELLLRGTEKLYCIADDLDGADGR